MKRIFVFFLILISAVVVTRSAEENLPPSLALTHVTIIDVTGGAVKPEMTVLITGDRITEVGASEKASVPPGTMTLNASGKFLIPGLWDMHVHWYDKRTLSLFIANGVTGVRQMFGNTTLLKWREEVANGSLVGPRMVVASPIVDGPRPFWPGSIAVGNEAEGRKAVKKVKAWGADFVKVYSFLPRDAYFGIAEEAKAEGIPFVGHVPWSISAAEASDAGQESMEHLLGIFLACSDNEAEIRRQIPQTTPFAGRALVEAKALESYDSKKAAALFERFVKNGTWQCPTLTVLRSTSHLDEGEFRKDPRLRFMPSEVRSRWERRTETQPNLRSFENLSVAKKVYPQYFRLVAAMNRAGVRFLAGTDTGNPYCFPGFSLHDELALLVEAGLTPLEALQAATVNAAEFLGVKETLGTIEKGKSADLVLLDANPLEDIRNTQKINAVILNGRLFDRQALDQMLDRAK